jgi:GT2 family glycosyltransferase
LMAGAGYRLGNLDPDLGQFDQAVQVISGCGAAVLYRRATFVDCGGLDLEFFAYLDDLDLGLRAQLLGFSGMYLPDAVAYHIGSATFGETLHPRVIEYLTRNQIYLLVKDYPRPVLGQLLPRIAVYQWMWLLFALRNRALGAYLRGLIGGFRGMAKMRAKHREVLAHRRINDGEFLSRLHDSERQVYDWHQSRPSQDRSALLNFYFRVFGRP